MREKLYMHRIQSINFEVLGISYYTVFFHCILSLGTPSTDLSGTTERAAVVIIQTVLN